MKKVYYLGIALATCLSSCSDDSLNNKTVENPVQTGDEVLFGTSLSSDINSRTIYGNRDENGVAVNWVKGDEIAIFCKETSQPANHLVNYKITPDENTPYQASEVMKADPNAAGLQWGDADIHNFYAFYPASAVHGTDADDQQGTITATIPVNQKPVGWREGNIVSLDPDVDGKPTIFALPDMNYAYMYAYNPVSKNTVQQGSGKVNLQFHNLVTVLDITIPGPASDEVQVTDVTVRAVEGKNPILTGDFNCYIRGAGGADAEATCTATGNMDEVRNVINISCYKEDEGKYVTLESGKYLNVKAYLIPDDKESNAIQPLTLQIAVNTLNGGEKVRTLQTATIVPHKVNRVLLPQIDSNGSNYWMSALDPNIYISELSIPGSKFSVLTSANGADRVYQNATIEEQLQDGIRAFIFQTATKGTNTEESDSWVWPYDSYPGSNNQFNYNGFNVICEGKDKSVMTLSDAISDIAKYLDYCESQGHYNEFAFVMLTYTTGDYDLGAGRPGLVGFNYTRNPGNPEQFWIEKLRDEVKTIAGTASNRIYTEEITPNTTIDDVKGKIILKANYNSQNMISQYGTTTAPIMFTYWGASTGPNGSDNWTYQDSNGGMPMDWGAPVWYANSTAQLRWYYQEVTSVGTNQEATKAQKEGGITHLFQESVNLYKNDNSHKTWFMNDLGGYYSDNDNIDDRGTGIEALALDMNDLGVQQLQKRTENAALGLIFMNFADKQANSGAKYKSDYLIQTTIMNNRKFQLRKKGDATRTYNSSYKAGGNAIGWDK